MPDPQIGKVPFLEAIEFFRQKNKVPTKFWEDMLGAAHAKSFTVAGAINLDVLNDLHKAVGDAIINGTTITDFRKAFDKTVAENGWSYKGKRGWRTRTIYDTNMGAAHMAGKWKQMQRVKKKRPLLQYLTAGDSRVRQKHNDWDQLILHIDDSWWDTHLPRNDFGCRCTARSLSHSQMKRDGLVINATPEIKNTPRINTRTGEFFGNYPEGVGVGFNYNVGKAWLGADIAFGEKLMATNPIAQSAAATANVELAVFLQSQFDSFFNEAVAADKAVNKHVNVGLMSDKVIEFVKAQKNSGTSSAMFAVSDADILLMSKNVARSLPKLISEPKAVLFDVAENKLVYVHQVSKGKASVFKTDSLSDKTNTFSKVIEQTSINVKDLSSSRFKLIDGRL